MSGTDVINRELFELTNQAAKTGYATNGAVSVRRFRQRRDITHLPHVSAYRFLYYINGNRVPRKDANRFIGE